MAKEPVISETMANELACGKIQLLPLLSWVIFKHFEQELTVSKRQFLKPKPRRRKWMTANSSGLDAGSFAESGQPFSSIYCTRQSLPHDANCRPTAVW
ncbi:MAG: hypothetical protein R2830_08605 [Saprospiraceae bacterium]